MKSNRAGGLEPLHEVQSQPNQIKPHEDALSEENFRGMLTQWTQASRFRESGSVYVCHPGIVLRRHGILLQRPDLVAEFFQGELPILVDIETQNHEDSKTLEMQFQSCEQKLSTRAITYWICGLDESLRGYAREFFHYLAQRQAKNPQISYVLFFSTNFLHPNFNQILIETSTFLQNIYFTPLYDLAMSEYFVQYLLQKWQVELPASLKKAIIAQTQHHPLLLKQAVRYIRNTGTTDLDEILHHPMMHLKVKSIFDSLLLSEQTALSKISIGGNDFTPDEQASITFLKQTGWLETRSHHLEISVPLLAEHIAATHTYKNTLLLKEHKLVVGQVPVDAFFSVQEQTALKLLLQAMGKVVTRDELAAVIWGSHWQECYSDWAIDKLISRLRKNVHS